MHFMDDRFVNLVEEVILTLPSQSGASESATVCFVISLSIFYWLLKCWVLLVVYVSVCMCERESQLQCRVCVCVLVCVREGDKVTQPRLVCTITMHWVSWSIRADSACQKEGLCREAGHRGPTAMYSIVQIMCFLNIKAFQHILLHQIMIFKKSIIWPL